MRRFLVGALAALVVFSAGMASAQQAKVEIICLTGQGNANGVLDFKLVARGAGCGAAAIFSHSQAYDGVGGGVLPTSAAEVAAAVQAGLNAVKPAGYQVSMAGSQCIKISGPSAFDVCVDGVVINTGGTYTENGLTVVGSSKAKVPAASLTGLAALTALMLGIAVLLRQRRANAV